MKLTCDACDTSFSVPDSAIGDEGRKVKCSKCGHMWIAKRAEPEAKKEPPVAESAQEEALSSKDDEALAAIAQMLAEDEEPPQEKKSAAPKISGKQDRLMKRLILLSLIGMVIASVFAFKHTLKPVLGPLYEMLGMVTSEQIVIQGLNYQKIPDEKKDRFTVSGEIVNVGDKAAVIPTLRISLLDEAREPFFSREYEEERMLEPKERYPFNVGRIETAFKGKAKFVIVEIGNRYELNARD